MPAGTIDGLIPKNSYDPLISDLAGSYDKLKASYLH